MAFIEEALRVLKLTRKPKKDEFLLIAKITGIGMIAVGTLGMIISIIGRFIGLK